MDRRIGSQTLADFQTWADLDFEGSAFLDGSTITLGARNVFDTSPRFANAGGAYGHDISQSELTGRFIYVRIRKRF
jgi:outer membrane receptor protein involved in Fe transport